MFPRRPTRFPQQLSILIGLAFLLGKALGQDEIVLRGSSKFDLVLTPFQGVTGKSAEAGLRRLLRHSGYFNIAATPNGEAYSVRGGGNGSQIDGILSGPQGQSIFRRGYRKATMKSNIQTLADDIISAVTGIPGITSSRIAFVGTSEGRKEIFTCDYDGSNARRLTSEGSLSVSPSISPDQSFVAFTSYASGYPDIYTLDVASGQKQRIANASGTNGGAAISPDGRRIACTMSFSGNKELYVLGRHGGRPRPLSNTPWSESSPAWSPDGSEIVYAADRGGKPQLYRTSASRSTATLVPTGFDYCIEPSWSPDGNLLAFTARTGGRIVVVIHDFRTGKSTILRAGEDPTWAPDSRHLAYTSNGGLYRIHTDSGTVKRLATNIGSISEPSWSQ